MAIRNFGQKWNGFNKIRPEGKTIVMREHIHYQIASYFEGILRKWDDTVLNVQDAMESLIRAILDITRVLGILWIKYAANKCLIVHSCICGKESDNNSRHPIFLNPLLPEKQMRNHSSVWITHHSPPC